LHYREAEMSNSNENVERVSSFPIPDRLRLHIAHTVGVSALGERERLFLAEGLFTALHFRAAPADPGGAGNLRELQVGQWFIRDDDLKLWDAMLRGVEAMAGAQFLLVPMQGKALSAVVGVAVAFVKACHAAMKKGVKLDPVSANIMSILRAHAEGLSIRDVREHLASRTAIEWSDDAVEELLAKLDQVRLNDGTVVSFAKDVAGLWRACGV
jgi:hypothetical protein